MLITNVLIHKIITLKIDVSIEINFNITINIIGWIK